MPTWRDYASSAGRSTGRWIRNTFNGGKPYSKQGVSYGSKVFYDSRHSFPVYAAYGAQKYFNSGTPSAKPVNAGSRFGRRSRKGTSRRTRRFHGRARGGFKKRVQKMINENIPWNIVSGAIYNSIQCTGANCSFMDQFVGSSINTSYAGDWNTLLGPNGLNISNASGTGAQMVEVDKNYVIGEYSNATNVPVHMEIYYCKPRRDQSLGTTVSRPLTALTYGATQYQGLGNGNTNAANQAYPLTLSPYQVPNFTTYYKITSKRHVLLQPGEQKTIYLASPIKNRMISSDQLTAQNFMRDKTRCALIKIWGIPIHDQTTLTNTQTAAAKLDIVLTYVTKGRCVKVQPDTVYYSNQQATVTVPRATIDESGVISTVAYN